MYVTRMLLQSISFQILAINVIPIWSSAKSWKYRQLIWGLRTPLDVITTLIWLVFLWNGAS